MMELSGVASLSVGVKAYGFTPNWTFNIMHEEGRAAEIIHQGHLENVVDKLVPDKDKKVVRSVLKDLLNGVLASRSSYLIEQSKMFHLELGPCVVKKFSFEVHYVVPILSSSFPDEGTYTGVSRSCVEKNPPGEGSFKIIYFSEFNNLYFKSIPPEAGQRYITHNPRSRLNLIKEEKEKEESKKSEGSASGVIKLIEKKP